MKTILIIIVVFTSLSLTSCNKKVSVKELSTGLVYEVDKYSDIADTSGNVLVCVPPIYSPYIVKNPQFFKDSIHPWNNERYFIAKMQNN